MDEQEFYDRLWNEFKDSDDNGTFTTWLVNKMGVINVYIERLRTELSQARASQGVPHEVHQATQRDIQRLREALENERQRNRDAIAPPVGQPRPVAPTPQPDEWVEGPIVPNTGGWRPAGGGPVDWNDNTDMAIVDFVARTRQDAAHNDTRRRLHEVGQQEEFERIRERLREIQALSQDRDSG